MSYTVELSKINEVKSSEVGSKAYNLMLLGELGLNVPSGLVIKGKALDSFLKRLDYDIDNGQEWSENGALEIFESIDFSDDLLYELKSYIAAGVSYAVRSSSTAEDLADGSFAGQYKTVLNVSGLANITSAIKKCWASFWSERSASYKLNRTALPTKVKHSVIIQEMINSEVSGVAFSANSITGRRDEIVIEAAWGLCEAVVSGSVTPDLIRYDKCNSVIKQYQVSQKELEIVNTVQGTTTRQLAGEKRSQPCLTELQIIELANSVLNIEQHLGTAVDVEWTIAEGILYILQARPITALLPLPDPQRNFCRPTHIYIDFNTVSQGVKEPMTPIGQETQRYYFGEAFSLFTGKKAENPGWLKTIKGRAYLNMTVFMAKPGWRKPVAEKISVKDPSIGESLLEVMSRNDQDLKNSDLKFKMPLIMPFRLAKHLYFPMVNRFFKGMLKPLKAEQQAIAYGEETFEQIRRLFKDTHSLVDTFRAIRKAQLIMMKFSFIQYCYGAYGFLAIRKAEKLIDRYHIKCNLELVRRSMPSNPTTKMGHKMIKIAYQLRESSQIASPNHPLVKPFISEYGHRGNIEMDIGTPRWHEETSTVIRMINGYVEAPNLDVIYSDMKNEELAASAEIDRIYDSLASKAGQGTAKKVKKLLETYRLLAGLRELPKFDLMKFNNFLRTKMLEAGEYLVTKNRLADKQDIAYLYEADLRKDNLQELVEDRKREYLANKQIIITPPILTSKGEAVYGSSSLSTDLKGYPVAPGMASGRIKKLLTPDISLIDKGDIILTYATNPSWTPLFIMAGGLIMESGGVMSHGSIVAREYGIPAIVLSGSFSRFVDNQEVTINGHTGEIVLENNGG